ncbi:hypothetical protein [Pseudomonas silesiensis]|uniref:hypothetical protein n=1 Tax=Pseudomonas silesiensis TaxID=1853130 RepID=UPI0034D3BB8B
MFSKKFAIYQRFSANRLNSSNYLAENRLRKRFPVGYAFFNKAQLCPSIGSLSRCDNKKEYPAMLHSGFYSLDAPAMDALRTSQRHQRIGRPVPGSIRKTLNAFLILSFTIASN